jgi:hypothetical protein
VLRLSTCLEPLTVLRVAAIKLHGQLHVMPAINKWHCRSLRAVTPSSGLFCGFRL